MGDMKTLDKPLARLWLGVYVKVNQQIAKILKWIKGAKQFLNRNILYSNDLFNVIQVY